MDSDLSYYAFQTFKLLVVPVTQILQLTSFISDPTLKDGQLYLINKWVKILQVILTYSISQYFCSTYHSTKMEF